MIISANIKKYREEKRLTQAELASQMNISRQSISKWERGDTLPSIDNLITLSELLDLSLDQLILNKEDLPLPLHFGKFKSNRTFVYSMILPIFMILNGFFYLKYSSDAWIMILAGFFIGTFIQEAGFIDLKQMYTYFTVTKTGIEYFDPKHYCPKFIRETLALFGIRPTSFIEYKDIKEMTIYFNNKGFQGHGTVIAYRPRQFFYNREQLLLVIELNDGQKIELNLDRIYFAESNERKFFNALFEYFSSRGILIKDDYKVLNSIQNEYDLIDEAYKLKTLSNK